VTLFESIVTGLDEARRHWGRTLLSLLGLVLGTGSIVAVLALFGGQTALTETYINEVGGAGTLIVSNRDQSADPTPRELAADWLTYRDAALLKERATSLALVSAGWAQSLTYRVDDLSFRGQVIGTVPDYAKINDIRPMAGRFLSDLDVERKNRVAVLGWKFADSLFGAVERAVGGVVHLDGVRYVVVGVMEREELYFAAWSGNALRYRNERGYIPITTAIAQYSANDGDAISFLTLKARSGVRPRTAEQQVRALLYARHGFENFDIRGAGTGDNDQEFFLLFNFIFLVVGVVSLFTGGIVIANILLASVVERVREFGTRMALGATPLGVFVHVLAEVLVVTVLGGVAGLGLGMALTGVVGHFMQMPAVVSPFVGSIAITTALGVGLLAGIYPALRASRLSPVEALRYG
jgi:putative ABC transport system permease protein